MRSLKGLFDLSTEPLVPRSLRLGPSALWAWLAVWLPYSLSATWPAAGIEGDDLAIANGAERFARIQEYGYGYSFQPGINLLASVGPNAFGVDGLVWATLCSAVGAMAFLVLGSLFVARLTGVSVALCAALISANQTWLALAILPNGTIVSATFLVGAAWVLLESRRLRATVLAGCLGALGLWFRFDGLSIVPALLLLVVCTSATPIETLRRLCLLIAGLLGTWLALFWATGGTVRATVLYVIGAPGVSSLTTDVLYVRVGAFISAAPFFFYPLIMAGAVAAYGSSRRMFAICVLGPLPLLAIAPFTVASPKHLFHAMPYLIALAAYGWAACVGRRWRAPLVAAGLLFVLQYPLGLRADAGSMGQPVEPVLVHGPTVFWFSGLVTGQPRTVHLVIGASGIVVTDDGYRLVSGLLFSPIDWHVRKKLSATYLETVERWLAECRGSRGLFADKWFTRQVAIRALLRTGFEPSWNKWLPRQEYSVWTSPTCRVGFAYWDSLLGREAPIIAKEVPGAGPVLALVGRDWAMRRGLDQLVFGVDGPQFEQLAWEVAR